VHRGALCATTIGDSEGISLCRLLAVEDCCNISHIVLTGQQALQIAATDYDELIIRSVTKHIGDPDKLGQLYFEVTFNDDPNITTLLPYREVKFVQVVRDYIKLHKEELKIAAADLLKQKDAPENKRTRRISQTLRGTVP